MSHQSELIAKDIEQYLKAHEHKTLLRFITCGSVDDGKSTLIGRLLYESKMIYEDQFEALKADSRKVGTQGERIDFALLVDGLAAEREQGITIDVAYRYFSTEKRKFIVADTPGHEQYTRNMITGASTADLAIVLIDARKGILTQTKRHTYLTSLMGIKSIVLAINKMDLVDYSKAVFDQIQADYLEFTSPLGLEKVTIIPISALEGDNIITPSTHMDWYHGTTLMGHLETTPLSLSRSIDQPFSMPVQWVNRPDQNFRGFAGTISSGTLQVGQKVRILPSGKESSIKSIITRDADLPEALASQAITITLQDEIDISRGDVLCAQDSGLTVADQLEAKLIWMAEEPLHPGRSYWLKCATKTVGASITRIKHRINVNTLEHMASESLELNDIAVCNIATDQALVFDRYDQNKTLGSFILIDRITNNTVGAGTIDFALYRAKNIVRQSFNIGKEDRALAKNQKPCVLWFTGLSGSGKSTIANLVEQELHARGKHTYILDGDNVRHGLNKDLGFTETDRVENIRRIAEVARLMVDAGLIVIVTFISPFRKDRDFARSLFGAGEFFEVYINTPIEECEKRDPKGLYKKARGGQIKNFTGIDSPYEKPTNPSLEINTLNQDAMGAVESIISLI